MPRFHETAFGQRFFNGQLPELIRNFGRIADCLEKEQERQATVKKESEGVQLEGMEPDYIEALTDSVNKAAGKKVVEVVEDSDIWMGTWLYSVGGSEGQWERYYFKNGTRQEVEDWMWGHDNGINAVGVYVEVVDFEIDTEWDIIDLKAEGWPEE